MTSSAPHSDFSTPSSERTVYFDAPIMHIFSKDDSHDDGFVAPPPARGRTSRNSLHYDYTGGQVRPRTASYNAKDAQGPSEHDDVRATDYAPGAGRRPPQEATSDGTAEQSDSGYSSGSPRNRTHSDGFKPVPVVWSTPPEDAQDGGTPQPPPASWRRAQELSAANEPGGGGGGGQQRLGMGEHRRSQSMRSMRPSVIDSHYDRESMMTTPSGRRTPRRRVSMNTGSFANGAGMIGPNAAAKEEETSVFRSRSMHADAGLSKKQKSRIGKVELKEGKRLVKVMKQEAKAEAKAVEVAMKELTEIQRMQKNAIKEEAKTNQSHAQALRIFHKEELVYLAARSKYERAQADLQAYEDAREAARDHARDATEMLQEKNREIEWLRAQKAADDREREAKIRQLTGKGL